MSSTHKSKIAFRVPELSLGTINWPDCIELRLRLLELQRHQPPADPEARPIRIGIEDGYGDLVHVVETTRLTEAVKVFELLSESGLVPSHGRCRASDGRTLTRTYRWPDAQDLASAAMAAAGVQRAGGTVPSFARL
ncbi:hypothetical protein [uncultured Azohydromonas sp.]|jgi:hypothetical protein|uniref:hypothetical protein n=1 Tax=uncultured Azohydromonas sp. TaxID=487342 RepID=UPI002603FF80|nr:hypothetical protein [uncultured Azohydromonas sp.]